MIIDWKKFVSIEILIFALGSLAVGITGWVDVKADIAIVQTESKQHERNYDRIDDKLDQIMSHLLREQRDE